MRYLISMTLDHQEEKTLFSKSSAILYRSLILFDFLSAYQYCIHSSLQHQSIYSHKKPLYLALLSTTSPQNMSIHVYPCCFEVTFLNRFSIPGLGLSALRLCVNIVVRGGGRSVKRHIYEHAIQREREP